MQQIFDFSQPKKEITHGLRLCWWYICSPDLKVLISRSRREELSLRLWRTPAKWDYTQYSDSLTNGLSKGSVRWVILNKQSDSDPASPCTCSHLIYCCTSQSQALYLCSRHVVSPSSQEFLYKTQQRNRGQNTVANVPMCQFLHKHSKTTYRNPRTSTANTDNCCLRLLEQ